MATSHSPVCKWVTAMLRAVSDEEHAVSTARLGPVKFKEYDILFATVDAVIPVEANSSIFGTFGSSSKSLP